jgi:threonine dehydrogenase-like Zn-dependent dehydrogenase
VTTATSSVRAAVLRAPRTFEVAEFPHPELRDGEVLMRVLLSGVCGTDKHTYRGETKQYAGTPHERDVAYPLICGHENVGVVEAVGPGGARASDGRPLAPGDRIVPGANVPCGRCHFCLAGAPYYFCDHLEDYGNSLGCTEPPHLHGGFAEQMVLLPGTPIFRVPDGLPDEVAVLTEPMAVTHGLDTARALAPGLGGSPFGDTVAVVGAGPLGLCHLVKARLTGCGRLIAVDRLPGRLAYARELGATLTLDAEETDLDERVARVREHTDGRGADIVVDCSGVPETFAEALRLVRFGGVVVEAGAFVDLGPVDVNPSSDICTRNVCVLGVGGETAQSYGPVLELLARSLEVLPLERFVTHRFGLAAAAEALELAQTDAAVKVAIDPSLQ